MTEPSCCPGRPGFRRHGSRAGGWRVQHRHPHHTRPLLENGETLSLPAWHSKHCSALPKNHWHGLKNSSGGMPKQCVCGQFIDGSYAYYAAHCRVGSWRLATLAISMQSRTAMQRLLRPVTAPRRSIPYVYPLLAFVCFCCAWTLYVMATTTRCRTGTECCVCAPPWGTHGQNTLP